MELKGITQFTELKPDQLRWRCDSNRFEFETTETIAPIEGIIGQERALKALRLGVALYGPGYNIFVCGLSGTGRATTLRQILERISAKCELAADRCYVNNFKNPDRPWLLGLNRGKAEPFRRDMEEAISVLRDRIPRIFDSEEFTTTRARIYEHYSRKERELLDEFTQRVGREGFALAKVEVGPLTVPEVYPVIDGQMVPVDKLGELVEKGKITDEKGLELRDKHEKLRRDLAQVYRKTVELSKAMSLEVEALEREKALFVVATTIAVLKERYVAPSVAAYLDEVQENVLDNLALFKTGAASEEESSTTGTAVLPGVAKAAASEMDAFRAYRVNVILAHGVEDGCPVIIETSPSHANLFGTVQRTIDMRGVLRSDFMDIKPGSLLLADGGYLIFNAMDAFTEPGVWKVLKRTLIHRKLEIQPADWMFPLGATGLKPEPIDVNVKVIMVGDRELYELLYNYEEDFKKIFKIKADFDTEMDMTDQAIDQYAALIRKLTEEDQLLHFDKTAIAAVVEYGVWRAGRQGKLTARFSDVADLAREAHYFARQAGATVVTHEHVQQALDAKVERHNLVESRIEEMIEKGVLLIDTTGARVGQVNGLSVYDMGDYAFGKPVRITAATSMGKAGIINIEREANLSGRLHDKGVQILAGYLRERFAQDKPLTLAASVCFEQSYAGVDGDSASSTEVYALLSSLSGVPIRQGIAVTGSVNQKGDIQAIGGLNQKIEGFYKLCKAKGLNGEQGVILPIDNVPDLMLREEVVAAVREGKFHLYPVSTIDEGIEILTGVRAGARRDDGIVEEGTINSLVDKRLKQLAEGLKDYDRAS